MIGILLSSAFACFNSSLPGKICLVALPSLTKSSGIYTLSDGRGFRGKNVHQIYGLLFAFAFFSGLFRSQSFQFFQQGVSVILLVLFVDLTANHVISHK